MWHIQPSYIILSVFGLILAALMLLDVATTTFILYHGGTELNPVMIGIVGSPLIHLAVKTIAFILIMIIAGTLETRIQFYGAVPVITTIVLYTFLAIHNITVAMKYI